MAPGDGQSLERPFGFRETHVAPSFGLPLHFPVQGAPGVPLQAGCGGKLPAGVAAVAQIGHGCVGTPVRMVWELSWKFHVAAPVVVLIVPVGADEKVFVTHTERPAFEIGSGVPNLQPTSVQSTPAGVDPDVVTPRVHAGPTHESVNRLVAPDGVELSGTCERPPPSERPPQARFFNGIAAPTSRNEFPHVPVAAVDRKSMPDGPLPSVVVLDVDVDVLLVLDVDELVDDEVDVEEDVDEDVLVELEVDVELLVDDDVDVLLVLEVDELVVTDDEVLVELEVDVLLLVDEDVLVEDEVLLDVDVLELVDVELLVEDEVDVELVDEVLLDVELDVLDVVVVVVAFGLQRGSSAPNSGTAA
jgi:hypothetical protein